MRQSYKERVSGKTAFESSSTGTLVQELGSVKNGDYSVFQLHYACYLDTTMFDFRVNLNQINQTRNRVALCFVGHYRDGAQQHQKNRKLYSESSPAMSRVRFGRWFIVGPSVVINVHSIVAVAQAFPIVEMTVYW